MAESVVARGKIKVDARRAIAKLRDHMLVDLYLYAGELARAAIATGATSLDVEWDADDVTFTFVPARPLAAAEIARARDHVLSPSDGEAGDALRLLGVGISAALGLGPSFVDVHAGAERVRFEPAHLDAGDDPTIAASAEPSPGIRVHVRRRVGLEVLARAVSRDAPREVSLLAAATRHAPLAVRLRGAAVASRAEPEVLLRVDLDEPSTTRAVLEVLAPAAGTLPTTEWLEHGIRLATYAGVAGWEVPEEPLPLRVVVDARKLPTNASRSEVRADAELVVRLRARVEAALGVALDALEDVVVRNRAPARSPGIGHRVEIVSTAREALEEALGAIAAHAAYARRAGHGVPARVLALEKLPLLRSVVGAPIAIGDLVEPVLVHGEQTPVALAPWLAGVVWRRGRAVERCLARLAHEPAGDRVARAKNAFERRARALAHAPAEPSVPPAPEQILREAFVVRDGPYAGLKGEIAVAKRDGAYRRSSTARLFVDERLLETVPLPAVSLPVDLALAWPGRIVARFDYDAVERGADLDRSFLYALRVAAVAIGERLGARDPELSRLAITAWSGVTASLGDTPVDTASLGALARAAVWPTTAGGVLVSLDTLERYVARTGALCTASVKGAAPDGRPVLVASYADQVRPFLDRARTTAIVPYDRVFRQAPGAVQAAMLLESAAFPAVVHFARANVEGFIAPGAAKERVYHAGLFLEERARPSANGPVTVVRDDRTAVPRPDYLGVQWMWNALDITREEDALVEVVAAKCESGELDPAVLGSYIGVSADKLAARAKAAQGEGDRARLRALAERLAELPARRERERLARLRQAFMTRAPLEEPDVTARLGSGGLRGTCTEARGSVTVALAPDAARWDQGKASVYVLFQGRPLVRRELEVLPVVALLDVKDESLVAEWADLSSEGVEKGGALLVRASVDLACKLVASERFAEDLGAMRLVAAILEDSPVAGAALSNALARAKWPTVQGPPLVLGARASSVPCGALAYAPYRYADERSPYDQPAVLVPRSPLGELRQKLLIAAGHTPTDVTSAIERLQSRRARGDVAPPRLAGAPAHPVLRARLSELAVTSADGELEITGGPASEVIRVNERGIGEPVALSMPVPVRIVFRAEPGVAESVVAAELRGAAERLVCRFGPRLEELPAYARHALRAVVTKGLRMSVDGALAVFPDTTGAWRSLVDLARMGDVRMTTDPPPYPPHDGGPPILVLTTSEAAALAPHVRVTDVTDWLRRVAQGLARRRAPPLGQVALSPEIRARCIFVFQLDEEGVVGEVGLLAPAHAGSRGLMIHTTKRPLCTMADGQGWPTVAALEVAGITPNEAFDGFGPPEEVARVRRAVLRGTGARASTLLEAPPDTMGLMRLPTPFVVRRGEHTVPCLGVFWIPRAWPEVPEVHVEAVGRSDPFSCPRAAAGVVPVHGRLWIAGSGPAVAVAAEEVYRFVLGRLPALVEAAARSRTKPDPAELGAYRWDLAILGLAPNLDVAAELAKDRPDPVLTRVAVRRAPHLVARPDDPAPAPLPPFAPDAPPDAIDATDAPAATAARAAPGAAGAPDASPPSEPFLAGLVRRLVELVSPPPPPAESELTAALAGALRAMKLTGEPVATVIEARRGRPVRYEEDLRRLVVNTRHPHVRALANDPSRMLFLLVAAVSEINRELLPVTDAEEHAVLLDLLRDREP
jgi:hypothetical protein